MAGGGGEVRRIPTELGVAGVPPSAPLPYPTPQRPPNSAGMRRTLLRSSGVYIEPALAGVSSLITPTTVVIYDVQGQGGFAKSVTGFCGVSHPTVTRPCCIGRVPLAVIRRSWRSECIDVRWAWGRRAGVGAWPSSSEPLCEANLQQQTTRLDYS